MKSAAIQLVSLDAYRDEDDDVFLEWCQNIESYLFLRKSFPESESPHHLFRCLARASRTLSPGNRVWAVRLGSGNFLIGHIELKCTDKTGPSEGEAVLFIGPGHRGKGYGGKAMDALIKSANTLGGFSVLLAVCRPTNYASIHIVREAGFTLARQEPEALWFRRPLEALPR